VSEVELERVKEEEFLSSNRERKGTGSPERQKGKK